MVGPRLFHLWDPLSHCYEEKWKSAIQFKLRRKWRCECSESTVNKNSKWLLECPTITALVVAFNAKMFNGTEVLQSYLAGGSRIIKLSGIYDFSYLCSKKNKHLAHMCSGIKTLKHNVWTTLRPAHHECKSHTHTCKTRQVKTHPNGYNW